MALDPDRAWQLHPRVSVRPEPFGALLYHFGTRKLSFLKDRTLVRVVESLASVPSAREACLGANIGPEQLPVYFRALDTLVESQMIVERVE